MSFEFWVVLVPSILAVIPIYYKVVKPIWRRIRGAAWFAQRAYSELSPDNPDSIRGRINNISIKLAKARSMTRMILDKDPCGAFETDNLGKCIWANKAYLKITENTMDDVLGNGWISTIYAEDRDRVYNEWNDAVEQERVFIMDYRIDSEDFGIINIHCEASPMIYAEIYGEVTNKQLIGYLGWIEIQSYEQSNP